MSNSNYLMSSVLRDDYYLVKKFAESDCTAISDLYKKYLPGVIRFITDHGGNEEDARDIFQESLLVLFKKVKAGEFRLTSSLKTYLFSICKYQWFNTKRNKSKIRYMEPNEEVEDLSAKTIKQLEKAEKYQLFKKHFSQLNTTNQQILNLYFQKKSTEMIAEELNLSKGYVKKMKYLLKQKLIKAIQEDRSFSEY